jgi:hypothetical protein
MKFKAKWIYDGVAGKRFSFLLLIASAIALIEVIPALSRSWRCIRANQSRVWIFVSPVVWSDLLNCLDPLKSVPPQSASYKSLDRSCLVFLLRVFFISPVDRAIVPAPPVLVVSMKDDLSRYRRHR